MKVYYLSAVAVVNQAFSSHYYGTTPPRPCVAGERGWWKTQAFSTNLPFLPRKAAGDASHNALLIQFRLVLAARGCEYPEREREELGRIGHEHFAEHHCRATSGR